MATYQEYHGISLAQNSWIENLFVEQLSSDPVPVGPGRVWYNTTDKKFKQSTLDATDGVIVRTFATEEDLVASVASLQSGIDKVASDLAAEVTRATDAEEGLTADLAAEVSNRTAADAALSARIDRLGNAFNYVGALSGGADAASATDLSALQTGEKDAGDYYKVTTDGYFKVGTEQAPFYANVNDGLVFNITGTVDKIDNTDSVVFGTADYIAVTGSADTGFTVDVGTAFKARVSGLESGVAAEASARAAADAVLQAAIDAEVTERQATDAALAAEVSRAKGVEGDLLNLTTDAKSNLVAAINEVQAEIITESSARIAADSAINTSIAGEASARQAADTVLQGNIDAEASARAAADAQLTSDLAAETTARVAADATLTTNLAAEVTRATAAEGVLTTNLAAEVTRATDAEAALQAAIDAETSARIAAVSAETTARSNADAGLQSAIDAEVAAREAAVTAEASTRSTADAALQASLDAETSAREAADTVITNNIGSLSGLTTTEKSTIVGAINEVKALAGDGVSSLVTKLNSYRYTYTSPAASNTHTITHGLGSTLVDVCVWIDRGDGKWRNDMAAVTIVDGTSVKVDLTAARNVRVTVERMDAIVLTQAPSGLPPINTGS